MFWDAEMETLARPTLASLQLERLRETVRRLERVPLYRDRFRKTGCSLDKLKTLDDFRRFPFTTAADLRENYPDGLLAVPHDDALPAHLERHHRPAQGDFFLPP